MSNIIIPSDPTSRKEIEAAIKEISNAKLRIESEQEYIKDTISKIHEKHGLPKPLINKVAIAYHKQTLQETLAATDDLEALYETLFNSELKI